MSVKNITGISIDKKPAAAQGTVTAQLANNKQKEYSQTSVRGYFSTIFHDFELTVDAVYNFYTVDELTSETQDIKGLDLSSVPRYNMLSWKTAPPKKIKKVETSKGLRKGNDGIQTTKGSFFNGKNELLAAKTANSSKFIAPSVSVVLEKPIQQKTSKITELEFLRSGDKSGRSFNEVSSNDLSKKTSSVLSNKLSSAVVNFFDLSIDGAFSDKKITGITKSEHAESIITLSTVASGLSTLNSAMTPELVKPSIPTSYVPKLYEGVEYIGYVIEKYRKNEIGSFDLVEEIDIPDPRVSSYVDANITYETVYRYRMKSVLRWARNDSAIDVFSVSENTLKDNFSSSNIECSYFESVWSRTWAYASVTDTVLPEPPDEFRIQVDSKKKRNILSWKIPEDRQQDIAGFKVLRKRISLDTMEEMEQWTQIGPAIFEPKNGLYVDNDVQLTDKNGHVGYIYSAVTVSKHGQLSPLCVQYLTVLDTVAGSFSKLPVTLYSISGVMLGSHGSFARVNPRESGIRNLNCTSEVLAEMRTGLTLSSFGSEDTQLRITSMTTGERHDIKLNFSALSEDSLISEQSIPPVVIVTSTPKLLNDILVGPPRSIATAVIATSNSTVRI